MDGAWQLRAAKELFARYPAQYWISGGWAVDLMMGRQRREHTNVDVLILADDLPLFARMPFLGPELVLLFKARDRLRARDPRDKDEQDFRDLAPLLTTEQRQWLIPRLTHPGADEHPWLPILQAPSSAA